MCTTRMLIEHPTSKASTCIITQETNILRVSSFIILIVSTSVVLKSKLDSHTPSTCDKQQF